MIEQNTATALEMIVESFFPAGAATASALREGAARDAVEAAS